MGITQPLFSLSIPASSVPNVNDVLSARFQNGIVTCHTDNKYCQFFEEGKTIFLQILQDYVLQHTFHSGDHSLQLCLRERSKILNEFKKWTWNQSFTFLSCHICQKMALSYLIRDI